MLDFLINGIAHALPFVQASRDAGIQYVDIDALRRYLDIYSDGRLAKLEREQNDRKPKG